MQEFYCKSIGVLTPTKYWGFYADLLFVYSYVYSSKHANLSEHGYQSFIDKVTEFHSIGS